MRFILEEPFKSLYRKAYLREDAYGRKRIDLVNSNTDRTTIAYARYLVCIKLGRILEQGYEVDHINGDCSDDRLDNLQILTTEQHIAKTASENIGRLVGLYVCPVCKTEFKREVSLVRVANPKCSRKCNGKTSTNLQKRCLTEQDVEYIRRVYVPRDLEFGIKPLTQKFGISKSTLISVLNKSYR